MYVFTYNISILKCFKLYKLNVRIFSTYNDKVYIILNIIDYKLSNISL